MSFRTGLVIIPPSLFPPLHFHLPVKLPLRLAKGCPKGGVVEISKGVWYSNGVDRGGGNAETINGLLTFHQLYFASWRCALKVKAHQLGVAEVKLAVSNQQGEKSGALCG